MKDIRSVFGKSSGTYGLVMRLPRAATLAIGRLGTFTFDSGYYVYTGSAFGPGGLAARIGRHLQRSKKRHWHIDYLRRFAEIVEIWYTYHPVNVECRWADVIRQTRGGQIPFPGFGSSDCRCKSHLFYFKKQPGFASFTKKYEEPTRVWRLRST